MQLKIDLSALKINQHLFRLAGRIEKSSRFIGYNILYLNISSRIKRKYLDNDPITISWFQTSNEKKPRLFAV